MHVMSDKTSSSDNECYFGSILHRDNTLTGSNSNSILCIYIEYLESHHYAPNLCEMLPGLELERC